MFPTKDVDRDDYEQFKIVYGREDNVMFLTITNGNIFFRYKPINFRIINI